MTTLPYRDFYYPLNVFMHVLTHEEGDAHFLHYGLFTTPEEPLAAAQEHSTELLLSALPPPPARLLEVGIGLATTLQRLTALGYRAEGITPDPKQIAMVRARYGDALAVQEAAFETFNSEERYDAILFQESSQYIDPDALFARAAALTRRVIVLDEFAQVQTPGAIHSRQAFVDAAAHHGFHIVRELDLSHQAAPTIAYFTARIPKYRELLIADLGLSGEQVDELVASGERYAEAYARGEYTYRFFDLERA